MNRNEVHEGYKKVLKNMLIQFTAEMIASEPLIEDKGSLERFVDHFISKYISEPKPEWNPGNQSL